MVKGLSFHEKKVLLTLQQLDGRADVDYLSGRAGLDQSTVMRAALALSEHGLTAVHERVESKAAITPEGQDYVQNGLPERRMLAALASFESATIDEVAAKAGLEGQLNQIALTWLRRKGWAEFVKSDEKTSLSITELGDAAAFQKTADEELLESLAAQEKDVGELSQEVQTQLQILVDRKLARIEEKSRRQLELTELGNQAVQLGIVLVEEVSELTHELLVSGKWKDANLRRYDVLAPGAPVYPGKVHPLQQIIDELREILLEMGFAETKSRIVESEFWNFDALFQAQDHPAREIHDSLSLSKPAQTKLPAPALLKKVIAAHERGVAGSKGWGYKFSTDISQRPVLCSQTTAATVRYLASNPTPPVKVFCIDRVYRHEKIDYKHLAEFYQCEGIVMDKELTLRDMLGYLKQIVAKLGLPKIRFRPGYFPYTEPSVEADVYFPEKGEWLEVLGAGMFRPELLAPLGIKHPVLAWGIGFSRLAMIKLGLNDIRDLYCNNLGWVHTGRMT